MNYLSICSVLKDEQPYILEWLDFHLRQGIEHFYLYCNDDDPAHTTKLLEPYIEARRVTLEYTGGVGIQRAAYNNFIRTKAHVSEYAAFIDIDEYLYSPLYEDLRECIGHYDLLGVSGVCAHWLLFGSSGHVDYSPEPVLKRFTHREARVNPHVKSIMRLSETVGTHSNVHCFRRLGDVLDEHERIMPDEYSTCPGTADVLRINHYVTKSRAECTLRRSRPRADSGEFHAPEFFEAHNCNDILDTDIWKRL